ncbi:MULTISPECIES: type II toxin-antitoxin system VapC family toxin [Mycolicibacter]|uniref:PIN domain nuclease n=1 Tax=Mycolicibacter virginiensis TaxID=1795032 RepID=A0A9X7IIU8_9MYCO|nr:MULTISPECIES: type II toxin-antitoxin system VapC family toxin [Mycobacteriaceae]OBG37754.1 twitching motility protein PilT [Mycolicibacter heraklionensis]OBJ32531.1 twitching motility protein PilT [Mycolicibacter heraklionensis]PQM50027.1 PIN domain nuclease [Mycolicibacter virginiensis]ULP47564.1 type II toxin-antitoxin system VapC family toxin [Mycolicibacter virginiensis]
MNVLLDTHTLLWLVSKPSNVDADTLAILSDPGTSVWVSAASAWEIATKTRLGRLDGGALLSTWTDVIADMSSTELAIDSADAILAGRLPWEHRDPFDRIIVAQALRRNLTVATRDTKIIDAAITPTLKA